MDLMVAGIMPTTMAAAAVGGDRREGWCEGEGEQEGVHLDRELTNKVLEGTARAGKVGGDGKRDDVRRPEAEMTGTVPAIAGTPARSRCPGREEDQDPGGRGKVQG